MKEIDIENIKASMITYINTKVIRATPMSRGEYNRLRGWQVPEDENPNDEGYLIELVNVSKSNVDGFDGYVSWYPDGVFDGAHGFPGAFRFSDAPTDVMRSELEYLEKKRAELKRELGCLLSTREKSLIRAQYKLLGKYVNVLRKRINIIERELIDLVVRRHVTTTIPTIQIKNIVIHKGKDGRWCYTS